MTNKTSISEYLYMSEYIEKNNLKTQKKTQELKEKSQYYTIPKSKGKDIRELQALMNNSIVNFNVNYLLNNPSALESEPEKMDAWELFFDIKLIIKFILMLIFIFININIKINL